MTPSRRQMIAAAAGTGSALLLGENAFAAPPPQRRPRIAAVYTVMYHRSHAHVILEKFLRPYLFNGKRITSPCDIVSIYSDQTHKTDDMTPAVSKQFKIPVFRSIADALKVGGDTLNVDGVLLIGEHGDYPINKIGQQQYPQKRFFDEIVGEMRRSKRFVPIFNDKHLSYRFDWAREMVDTARKHRIPLMAGSSVPLAQRRPNLEIANGAALEEAISIHGGPIERYDFHGFEVLQSMVENRKGGETGVTHVEFLQGDALWQAADKGRWNVRLAEAALRTEFGKNIPNIRKPFQDNTPHAILLTYRDGFKATVLRVGYSGTRWNFAVKYANDNRIRAMNYHVGPWRNRCLFMALSHAIQHHFVQRRAPYPVERTLLTSGLLEAAMQSRFQKGRRLATPQLRIAYQPQDFRAMREMGASWKVMGDRRELRGITPLGEK